MGVLIRDNFRINYHASEDFLATSLVEDDVDFLSNSMRCSAWNLRTCIEVERARLFRPMWYIAEIFVCPTSISDFNGPTGIFSGHWCEILDRRIYWQAALSTPRLPIRIITQFRLAPSG